MSKHQYNRCLVYYLIRTVMEAFKWPHFYQIPQHDSRAHYKRCDLQQWISLKHYHHHSKYLLSYAIPERVKDHCLLAHLLIIQINGFVPLTKGLIEFTLKWMLFGLSMLSNERVRLLSHMVRISLCEDLS